MYNYKIIYSLFLLFVIDSTLFGRKLHSKIEFAKKKDSKNSEIIEVKIYPLGNNVINTDGNWSLKIEKPIGIQLKSEKFTKQQFDYKIPGYSFSYKIVSKESASFDYVLMAFVCTKDKKICYFDRHKGTYSLN